MKQCYRCKQKKRLTIKVSVKVGGDDSEKWCCMDCLRKEMDKK